MIVLFPLFLIIDNNNLTKLIIFVPTAELLIPIGKPTNEANAKI